MKKYNNKKLIISHVADIDGMGSVILGKLEFFDLDFKLVEFAELDSVISTLIDSKDYYNYDEIYITDVSIRNKTILRILNEKDLVGKIKHFDHHASDFNNNKIPFINEVIEKNGVKVSGTSLFYDYLLSITNDKVLRSDKTKQFVEAIRSYDTWDWTINGNLLGKNLTDLLSILGPNTFIDKYFNTLLNEEPFISKSDEMLIVNREKEINKYVEKCDESLIKMNLGDHYIGVSFSELYRNEVGNTLSNKYIDELDYILMINMIRKTISLRTVRNDINVGIIANELDQSGGGQPKTGGLDINDNTKWIILKASEALKNPNINKSKGKNI